MVGDLLCRLQRIIQSPTSSLAEHKGELGVAKGGRVGHRSQCRAEDRSEVWGCRGFGWLVCSQDARHLVTYTKQKDITSAQGAFGGRKITVSALARKLLDASDPATTTHTYPRGCRGPPRGGGATHCSGPKSCSACAPCGGPSRAASA